MAGVTFSEGEVKRLILALAGSRSMGEEPEVEEKEEKDDEPEEKMDDKPEGDGEGKPFGKEDKSEEESTKDMLARKLKEKGSK